MGAGMLDRMTTADIARALNLSREYVTDKVVKRPDFPNPVLVLSRKTVQWARADVDAWIGAQAIRAAGQSARPTRGNRRAKAD